MAPNYGSYLLSGSRGKILVVVSAFFLLTVLISFRGVVTNSNVWKATVTPITESPESEFSATPTTSVAPFASNIDKFKDVAAEETQISTSAVELAATTSTTDSATQIATVGPDTTYEPEAKIKYDCDSFPDTSDILLVMKTGATEAYDKLPIHFMTTLRCVQDSILFSDMEMDMAGHRLIDVLANISEEVKQDNDDFELYETLKEYHRLHEDPRALKAGMNGWNLDKYKFVPMMTQTWDYRKDAAWYVFVEADTAVNWDNLRTYLNTLDSRKPYYIGSPTYLDIEFAHGGTGYVISNGAMAKAVGKHPDLNEKYNQWVQPICCGDRMIARILLDEDIRLTKAWPMFNGEKPLTLPFGEDQWCQPVITMHHMTAQEVSQVWVFDQKRKAKGITDPMVWKDVFNYFVASNILSERTDWENLSKDVTYRPDPEGEFNGRKWEELEEIERKSPESVENCKALCEYDWGCFQWMHHGQECGISHSIKLGGSRRPEGNERWVSGWMGKRIDDFRNRMGECEGGFDWKTHGP